MLWGNRLRRAPEKSAERTGFSESLPGAVRRLQQQRMAQGVTSPTQLDRFYSVCPPCQGATLQRVVLNSASSSESLRRGTNAGMRKNRWSSTPASTKGCVDSVERKDGRGVLAIRHRFTQSRSTNLAVRQRRVNMHIHRSNEAMFFTNPLLRALLRPMSSRRREPNILEGRPCSCTLRT